MYRVESSEDVSDTSATPQALCESTCQDGKSGFKPVSCTAAFNSCTTLSSEFHGGYATITGLDLSRKKTSTDLRAALEKDLPRFTQCTFG